MKEAEAKGLNKVNRIFLTGYMGVGKTTLGRALSHRLSWSFIDTDVFIENRYHKRICDLFSMEGEERFREIERKALSEIAEFEYVVVSTGGGLPCFYDNMEKMNSAGATVWLEAPVEELAGRLEASAAERPVLQHRKGEELRAFITENLSIREPFYRKAQIRFTTEKMHKLRDADKLARSLIEKIGTIYHISKLLKQRL
jgi:shikimate kinase